MCVVKEVKEIVKSEVTDVENEGLLALLGKKVLVFCVNYIYTGTLTGVNDTCIKLDKAHLVYETGAFSTRGCQDAQRLPAEEWYIQRSAIEAFGLAGVKEV